MGPAIERPTDAHSACIDRKHSLHRFVFSSAVIARPHVQENLAAAIANCCDRVALEATVKSFFAGINLKDFVATGDGISDHPFSKTRFFILSSLLAENSF